MSEPKSYLILRDIENNNGDLELFIADHGNTTNIHTAYNINLEKQLIWLTLLVKNITKHFISKNV